ncbi:lytic transglycosylase domain-containing protein [Opitutus sp. ER46]|uniref:lytic transglycosylase domain-containing protein n=1 Tax=Opitutus sp. ER46 TaxID=2161864 RepID=UPI000D2F7F73|nr:lytic transglycosylase domain-containing protein [Opitutus sp. ER46]PTX98595.1 lytic transglycosylase [Opitutus sp. ER46]
MRLRLLLSPVPVALLLAASPAWAVTPGAPPPATPPPQGASAPAQNPAAFDPDALYEAGRQLFEEYAPPEVKEEYMFPSKEQWAQLVSRLQAALEGDSLDEMAARAPEARNLLNALRLAGAEGELADWLAQRLDELDAAQQAKSLPAPRPKPAPRPEPGKPGLPPPTPGEPVPYYDLWFSRVKNRPIPGRASELVPTLREVFVAEGAPPSLVWLAEAESSFNPQARSPVGARGLFQLMPETARSLGLDTFLPDEREHPEKSARAAARYLRRLHGRFGSWPLALAAYNAGEGRVSRALAKRQARDYASIADALPAETRMYVPKVCALVAVRSGTNLW